jgi:hypothetical protein
VNDTLERREGVGGGKEDIRGTTNRLQNSELVAALHPQLDKVALVRDTGSTMSSQANIMSHSSSAAKKGYDGTKIAGALGGAPGGFGPSNCLWVAVAAAAGELIETLLLHLISSDRF